MSDLSALGAAAIVVVEFAAAVFVAWRVSGAVVGADSSRALRITTGCVVGMTQVIGVQMLCAALDVLYFPVVLALHLIIAFGVWLRVPVVDRPRRPVPRTDLGGIALWSVLAFSGLLGALMSERIPSDPDSRQYHIPNAASWLQVHNLWHLPATNPGYFTNGYPSDGELVTSWIIQPLHQPQWSALPSLLFGFVILAGASLLSEELGGSARHGLLAGTAILLSPLSWTAQVGTALTDWVSLSGLVIAVALVLHATRSPGWRWLVLAGLALGIAVGSKDTALVPAVFVIALAATVLPGAQRMRGCLLMLGGVVALAGVWFARDAVQTGNPLYPEPVRVAGTTVFRGGVGPVTAWSSSVLKDVFTGNTFALKIWLETFAVWIGPAVLLCAWAALCLARLRRRDVRSLLAAIAGIWFLVYVATPYTGPGSFPLLITSQVRYALPAMAVAGVCAAVESRWMRRVAWIAIAYNLWALVHGVHLASVPAARMNTPRVAFVLVAIAGALVVGGLIATSQGARLRPGLARAQPIAAFGAALSLAVLASTLMAVVAARHVATRSRLDVALAVAGKRQGPVMIDGDGDVLAAMGVRLQHRVVSAGGGGAPHQVPLSTPTLLDARVLSVDPAAVIVGPPNWPGVIPGWAPPGYHLLYNESGRHVYVKNAIAELSDRNDIHT